MDVGGLLARLAPPPGDAGQVRAAAEHWRRAAADAQDLVDTAVTSAAAFASSWHGPASGAFGSIWRALAAHVSEGASQLRATADALDGVAHAIDDARSRYWQLMAGAGVGVTVGLLLTPVTLGASDVIADGAVAGEIAVLLSTLAEALGVEASVLAGVAAAAARLVGSFTIQATAQAGTDALTGAVLFPDHDPFGHVDVGRALRFGVIGALAPPAAGVLSRGLAGAAPGLAASSATGGVARVVVDGASFGLADAAVQLTASRRVDPGELAFAVLGATAGSSLGRALLGRAQMSVPAPPALDLPALPPRLARVLDKSTEVPSGRSFFSPTRDPWLARAAPLVPLRPGAAVVFAHGTTSDVIAGRTLLTPQELAAIIRADALLAGRRVRLFACETGRLDDGFAARLARELGVEVEAPTELAWLGPGGEMSTTSGRLVGDAWVQTVPDDGRWRTFAPRDS
jgi:uncharacterized protein YukE